jgi:hypothetical protein
MLSAQEYQREHRDVLGWSVNVTSYKIGDRFYCHIDNIDPGATIARTDAQTRDEAITKALETARERLSSTRTM